MPRIRTTRPTARRITARRSAVALAVVATTLAACGTSPAAPDVSTAHTGERRVVQAGALTGAEVAAGHTAFGLDMLHRLCAERPGENVLVSPTSAALALGLLQPAADGAAAERLAALLHLPAWSPDLEAAMRASTDALAALAGHGAGEDHAGEDDDDAPDTLRISNRVWTSTDPGSAPEQHYLDAVATGFGAGVEAVDFAGDPRGATDAINAAVERDTAGMIPTLFDDPLSATVVSVLTNAVHLDARWRTPFAGTGPAQFAAPGGPVTVDLMTGGAGTARDAAGWTAVELPYRDGTLAAVAVLPPAGTDPCTVDQYGLAALEAAEPREVDVDMPRLSLDATHGLMPLLEAMGLDAAGDYSALCGPCWVSDVVQKVVLEVDQVGTEAAAATGVVMESSARAPRETVTFDRPYLLLLTDTATRSPLFVTVVQDPTG